MNGVNGITNGVNGHSGLNGHSGVNGHSYNNTGLLAAPIMPPLNIPQHRLLMGPGPSNCAPRVLKADSQPVIGHMHKEFFQIMDEIKGGLKYLFQTANPWTVVVSGPGHLAMEAILVNLLESTDKIVVGVNGIWGLRAADLAHRLGSEVVKLEGEAGTAFSLEDIEAALSTHKPQVLFLVHSESSSGIVQPLEGVGALCRKHNCLLAVDTVASLGGVPFHMDKWEVDAAYTGSQKVIGAPPGMSPISFGPRSVMKIKARKTPIKSFLLDMTLLTIYWACNEGDVRTYHHTPPVTLFYGLHEALSMIVEEGLENLWKRHETTSERLRAGIKALGLDFFVKNPDHRLKTVTTIKIPSGIDWKHVTQYAMDKYEVEIAGGLGLTVGKVLRIGCMGNNAYPEKVDRVLQALKEGLQFANLHGRL